MSIQIRLRHGHAADRHLECPALQPPAGDLLASLQMSVDCATFDGASKVKQAQPQDFQLAQASSTGVAWQSAE